MDDPGGTEREGPGTLGGQVYAELCDRLIGGELPPGEKISLRSLAEALGTSVMPVREAVSRLVADGALTVSPNRAVSVPVMTLSAFRELTTVRIAIEGFAAERAALGADAAALGSIRRFDAAFRRQCGLDAPDAAAAMRANREFHFAVYGAGELPALVKIISGLWLKVGPVLNFDMRLSPQRLRPGGAEAHHARCVEAIARRDPGAARAAITGDIEAAAAFIASTGWLPET